MATTRRGASSIGVVLGQAVVLVLIGAAVGIADSRIRPVNLGLKVQPGPERGPAVPVPQPDTETTPPTPTPDPAPQTPPQPPPSPTIGTTPASAAFVPAKEADLAGKQGHITLERGFEMHQFMGAIFLDARNAEEYAAGHIEGAHFAPLSRFRSGDIPPILTTTAVDFPIVVYCGGGDDCQASEDVALHLNGSGFFNVHVLHDGYIGWQAMGHPIAIGAPR